jgi:hypothetical protein
MVLQDVFIFLEFRNTILLLEKGAQMVLQDVFIFLEFSNTILLRGV